MGEREELLMSQREELLMSLIHEHLAARWRRKSHLLLIEKSDHDAQRSMLAVTGRVK